MNTDTNELDFLYSDYGCNLKQFLGLKKSNTTVELIKNTIVDTLERDKRLNLINIDVEFVNDDKISILLNYSFNDEEIELNLELSDTGVDIDG